MKTLTNIILIFLFIILIFIESLLAQHNRIFIENELQRLNESLSFANELVLAFGNRQARQALQEAKRSMDKAIEQFRQNHLDRSKFLIGQSYDSITFAMNITFKLAGGSLLDRLRDLIRQVEQVVEGCENKEAARLLRKAKKNQQMALRSYRKHMIRETFEYYRLATFLARRALMLCDIKHKNLHDQFLEEKERFQQLLQKAENLCKENRSERAALLIQQARKQALQTHHAYNTKKYKQALEHYYKATRLLLRAIELCESRDFLSHDRLERKAQNELTLLNEFIESAQEKLAETRNARAKLLFQRALQLKKEAQQAFNMKRFIISLKKSELARNALGRAHHILNSSEPGLEVRVESEIDKLKNDLKNVEELAKNSSNQEATEFIGLSRQFLDKSVQACEKKQYRLALEEVLVANRLLNMTRKLARTSEIETIDRTEIERRLDEFEGLISTTRAEIESSNNKLALNLLKQAQDLFQQSKRALLANQLVSKGAGYKKLKKLGWR